jgi:chaperonin GroES
MNVRPLADRILVTRVAEQEKTRGGIIIPDSAKERPLEGKVVSVGSGKRAESGEIVKLDVKAGDRILFGKYAGTEIKVDGVEHIILREEEVLGIIEG